MNSVGKGLARLEAQIATVISRVFSQPGCGAEKLMQAASTRRWRLDTHEWRPSEVLYERSKCFITQLLGSVVCLFSSRIPKFA